MDTIFPDNLGDARGPKYRTVASCIRTAIADGTLQAGDRLPPVRDLAWRLKITPGTVARAYTVLTDEGLLNAEVGRGTYVAEPKTDRDDDVWGRLTEPQDAEMVSLFSPRLPDMGQVALMRRALAGVAESPPLDFLNYPTRDAYRPVRQAVVDWLAVRPLGPVSEDEIVLSHGGQNAISLVLQAVLRGPRPMVLVEDLTYAGFRRAAETLRADVQGVAMDEAGVLPEALDAAIRASEAQVFCTSPDVHNPTGLCTPIERRKELAEVCRRHGVQILEDDCYCVGQARAPHYRMLLPGQSWYVSSLSKSLTPALRFGYAIAPAERAADLRRVSEHGFFGLARPLADIAHRLLADPESRAICDRVRERIGEYVEVAVNVLGGFDLTWSRDVSFLWLRLPSGWRAAAFCRAAEGQGVQIRSADEFALRDGRAPHAVRIAINGQVSLRSFEAAMQRLRSLLDNPPEQIMV
ncbi:PLP-dependent aminotransferase family protein [Sulfitobacter sp. D35]|uniref:aminotransferase-like domain-containing protein n=1 Tax=Sulfitobacter sp. D35 TaxID=3083252 RepID=UPI00296FC35B|nr:PLP-dependent aminotransferase family protein [Sulfitobacter sp. D35]MDW4497757.1 PLP-dependent aminotransferase family protein [Sulfitobacter sp. D35]